MVIHHMADGSIRDSIEGMKIPKSFNKVYEMIYISRKENDSGNSIKIKAIKKE